MALDASGWWVAFIVMAAVSAAMVYLSVTTNQELCDEFA
jgi:hypothetical protein